MRIYDTFTRELKEIESASSTLTMYCCGPTVYRDVHVGNLRTFLLSDLIRRTLQLSGKSVKLVQNITDVGHLSEDFFAEDKLLTQSRLEKRDPFALARSYESGFHEDLKQLNILPANLYPRASEHISLMQDLISRLFERGNAYIGTDGSVYFDATTFPSYGALSGNRLDALKPGHRYEFTGEGGKRFHADWVLWKSAGSRTEIVWDSPWGKGFPGWHIECSAMSLEFLDQHIDVHVGGIDLRFPHHENERAQSNATTGSECVGTWVHGEHLLFEGRKMSKSAGNALRLSDVVEKGFDPLSVRLVFLENRYRSQMDLTWDSISAAHATLARWRMLITGQSSANLNPILRNDSILHALNEDLDTPRTIQYLRNLEKNSQVSESEKVSAFLFADQVLGLELNRAAPILNVGKEVHDLLEERKKARDAKNWMQSDKIREQLKNYGISVQDTENGQTWSLFLREPN